MRIGPKKLIQAKNRPKNFYFPAETERHRNAHPICQYMRVTSFHIQPGNDV